MGSNTWGANASNKTLQMTKLHCFLFTISLYLFMQVFKRKERLSSGGMPQGQDNFFENKIPLATFCPYELQSISLC